MEALGVMVLIVLVMVGPPLMFLGDGPWFPWCRGDDADE